MKVFVQIPCLNEESTLPLVLATIPRQIPGVDQVEILVIDDGSTDKTLEVAQNLGVKHIIRHTQNMGLARSFRDGLDYALAHGADIIVNTDGDNQYPQQDIPKLLAPLLSEQADIAIGDRQTASITHFSPVKKALQRLGSGVVSIAAATPLPDAASGFRAYTREAALGINVITQFSYCMESIIQAGNKRFKIVSVPITTNPRLRDSRLFKSNTQHISQSARAIFRSYIMYKPNIVFASLGTFFTLAAFIPFIRFLILFAMGDAGGHIQSLLLGVALLVVGVLCFEIMVLADLLRTNRTLIEQTLERVKDIQYKDIQHEPITTPHEASGVFETPLTLAVIADDWERA